MGTISSGKTAGTIVHGLSFTPTQQQITLQALGFGSATKLWLGTAGTSQFTVNVDTDPGATTTTFAWKAST